MTSLIFDEHATFDGDRVGLIEFVVIYATYSLFTHLQTE
jgi:hypothetical protein